MKQFIKKLCNIYKKTSADSHNDEKTDEVDEKSEEESKCEKDADEFQKKFPEGSIILCYQKNEKDNGSIFIVTGVPVIWQDDDEFQIVVYGEQIKYDGCTMKSEKLCPRYIYIYEYDKIEKITKEQVHEQLEKYIENSIKSDYDNIRRLKNTIKRYKKIGMLLEKNIEESIKKIDEFIIEEKIKAEKIKKS